MALGLKLNETRGKVGPGAQLRNYRGSLGIHAALRRDSEASDLFADLASDHATIRRAMVDAGYCRFDLLPFGAVVAVVDVFDCVETDRVTIAGANELTMKIERLGGEGGDGVLPGLTVGPLVEISQMEWDLGNYGFGRLAIVTRNVRRLKTPLPWRGAQGLFQVPDELIDILD
jgi:hypothetical protein